MANVWYIDGTNGSDANSGLSPSLPRLHMPAPGASDIIYVSGKARGSNTYTGIANLQVLQWPGMPQGYIWGGTVVASSAWTHDTGNAYTTPVTPVHGIAGVFVYSAVPITPTPGVAPSSFPHQPGGAILTIAGSIAACRSTNNSWILSGGLLYVNLAGDNPSSTISTLTVEYCDTDGQNLLQFTSCVNPTVRGLIFALNPHSTFTQGYGVYMTGCSNPTIDTISGFDLGGHAFGCLVSTGMQSISNVYCEGLHESGTYFVFYQNGEDLTGCRGTNLSGKFRRWLKRDGTEVAVVSSASQLLGYSHVDGGNFATDIEYSGCTATAVTGYHSGGTPQFIDSGSCAAVSVANSRTYNLFPVRVTDSACVNMQDLVWNPGDTGSHIAFRRTRFDLARPTRSSASFSQGNFAYWASGSGAVNSPLYFEACEFVINVSAVSTSSLASIFSLNNNNALAGMFFVNPSILIRGTGSRTAHTLAFDYFSFSGGNNQYHVEGGIIAFEDANASHNWLCGDGDSGGVHDFSDTIVYGVGAGNYSEDAAKNTAAEWFSLVDTTGKELTADPWSAAPSSLALMVGSAAWGLRRATSTHVPGAGINGPYANNYGAYQYAASFGTGSGGAGGKAFRMLVNTCATERKVQTRSAATGGVINSWVPVYDSLRCNIQGDKSTEALTAMAERGERRFRVYLPVGADVQNLDRITTIEGPGAMDGVTLEVTGPAIDNAGRDQAYLVVPAREVKGGGTT